MVIPNLQLSRRCLAALESCNCQQEILLSAKSQHDKSALMLLNSYLQTMCAKDLFSSIAIITSTRLCSIEINDD